MKFVWRVFLFLILICTASVYAGKFNFSGQASATVRYNMDSNYFWYDGWHHAEKYEGAWLETGDYWYLGWHLLPELQWQQPLSDDLLLDCNLTLSATHFIGSDEMSREKPKFDIYRSWLRLSGSQFEFRLGRQKINFGPATFFRPLMWFNQVDARDPLQIAEGVWGGLGRYCFLNNTNVWLWALYGNDEKKGWESLSTKEKSIEVGGRVQAPILTGEIGISSHYRKILFLSCLDEYFPEYRIGLDGKWNFGVGLWFEGAFTYQDYMKKAYQYGDFRQFQMTIGADYTMGLGNGLTTTVEYFHHDITVKKNLECRCSIKCAPPFPAPNLDFAALGLKYPFGLADYFSAVVYYDMQKAEWYRLLDWQRTLDEHWKLHLLGYWNPDNAVMFSEMNFGMNSGLSVSGKGVQLFMVCNF